MAVLGVQAGNVELCQLELVPNTAVVVGALFEGDHFETRCGTSGGHKHKVLPVVNCYIERTIRVAICQDGVDNVVPDAVVQAHFTMTIIVEPVVVTVALTVTLPQPALCMMRHC